MLLGPVRVRGRVRSRFSEILSNCPVVLYHFRSIGFRSNGFRSIGFRSNGMNPMKATKSAALHKLSCLHKRGVCLSDFLYPHNTAKCNTNHYNIAEFHFCNDTVSNALDKIMCLQVLAE